MNIGDPVVIGAGANAEAATIADIPSGGASGPRVPGRIGNAVKLNGSDEYVSLPTGIVSGLSDFTISAWVNPASDRHLVPRLRLRHGHRRSTCS